MAPGDYFNDRAGVFCGAGKRVCYTLQARRLKHAVRTATVALPQTLHIMKFLA